MSGSQNEGWGIECACFDERATNRKRKSNKSRSFNRKVTPKGKPRDKKECESIDRNKLEYEIFGNSGERNSTDGEYGEDGGESRRQRLRCRQRELNAVPNKIDMACVTTSRDLTSKSAVGRYEDGNDHSNSGKKKSHEMRSLRSCSFGTSTCSEGSYSRKKHHKNLKHKHKHKDENRSSIPMNDSSIIHPKVNPVFVWVHQEGTRIVEVFCEDYDYKNRIKLRRTHLGWRAIPKTKRFADVLLSKAPQSQINESLSKPKKMKICKRWKKSKKSKKIRKNFSTKQVIDENSTTAVNSECKNDDISVDSFGAVEKTTSQNSSCSSHLKHEPIWDIEMRSKSIIKSNSCDFSRLKVRKNLVRSASLDLNFECDVKFCLDELVIDKGPNVSVRRNEVPKDTKCVKNSKSEETIEIDEANEGIVLISSKTESNEGNSSADNQRNHSETVVMDMTKHDSDFNDADCEELGQLLKVIPDLEFVREDELEHVDEEEWSTPTDLTLPKTPSEEKVASDSISALPLNISPLITVTSAARPSEPLMAPLPEVTITPIPKPAHQKRKDNNFLEHLLSSAQAVKPEVDDRTRDKRLPIDSFSRKTCKHWCDDDIDKEAKHKKLKSEDITLKNLLSKHGIEKQGKGMDLEKCVQNLKALNVKDFSKSRLHELLTNKNPSDPISELKEVLSDPDLAVPDPLLVPRARLPALVASPASEIPRLLTMHLEKTIEEKARPPLRDSDFLEVSLSNLESLLSTGTDTSPCINDANIANYQKSLEGLLGWQKYSSDLIDNQINNSKTFSSDYAGDVAAATALSQMLWLPYLNQFDFNANRNIMSLMNSVFSGESQLSSPPQISISQVSQPSPFLTPTSPMDVESQLKTLAMWQDTATTKHSTSIRFCSKSSGSLSDAFKDGRTHHLSNKKQCCDANHLKASSSLRKEMPVSAAETLQYDHQKKPRHANESEVRRQDDHMKRVEAQQRGKWEFQNQTRKPIQILGHPKNEERGSGYGVASNGNIHFLSGSVKPMSNSNLHKSGPYSKKKVFKSDCNEFKGNYELTNEVALRLQQFNTEIHRTTGSTPNGNSKRDKSNPPDTPKLKVKNLVDPSMSPPKLLKQIGPEDLAAMNSDSVNPAQDVVQGHLWHPLFGSNQIKIHPYNSPWQWTTVTVNGE